MFAPRWWMAAILLSMALAPGAAGQDGGQKDVDCEILLLRESSDRSTERKGFFLYLLNKERTHFIQSFLAPEGQVTDPSFSNLKISVISSARECWKAYFNLSGDASLDDPALVSFLFHFQDPSKIEKGDSITFWDTGFYDNSKVLLGQYLSSIGLGNANLQDLANLNGIPFSELGTRSSRLFLPRNERRLGLVWLDESKDFHRTEDTGVYQAAKIRQSLEDRKITGLKIFDLIQEEEKGEERKEDTEPEKEITEKKNALGSWVAGTRKRTIAGLALLAGVFLGIASGFLWARRTNRKQHVDFARETRILAAAKEVNPYPGRAIPDYKEALKLFKDQNHRFLKLVKEISKLNPEEGSPVDREGTKFFIDKSKDDSEWFRDILEKVRHQDRGRDERVWRQAARSLREHQERHKLGESAYDPETTRGEDAFQHLLRSSSEVLNGLERYLEELCGSPREGDLGESLKVCFDKTRSKVERLEATAAGLKKLLEEREGAPSGGDLFKQYEFYLKNVVDPWKATNENLEAWLRKELRVANLDAIPGANPYQKLVHYLEDQLKPEVEEKHRFEELLQKTGHVSTDGSLDQRFESYLANHVASLERAIDEVAEFLAERKTATSAGSPPSSLANLARYAAKAPGLARLVERSNAVHQARAREQAEEAATSGALEKVRQNLDEYYRIAGIRAPGSAEDTAGSHGLAQHLESETQGLISHARDRQQAEIISDILAGAMKASAHLSQAVSIWRSRGDQTIVVALLADGLDKLNLYTLALLEGRGLKPRDASGLLVGSDERPGQLAALLKTLAVIGTLRSYEKVWSSLLRDVRDGLTNTENDLRLLLGQLGIEAHEVAALGDPASLGLDYRVEKSLVALEEEPYKKELAAFYRERGLTADEVVVELKQLGFKINPQGLSSLMRSWPTFLCVAKRAQLERYSREYG